MIFYGEIIRNPGFAIISSKKAAVFCGRLKLTDYGYKKPGLGHRATEHTCSNFINMKNFILKIPSYALKIFEKLKLEKHSKIFSDFGEAKKYLV